MQRIASILLLLLVFSATAQERLIVVGETSTPYFGATAGNGQIGITPGRDPFAITSVMLNHVFDRNDTDGVSRVLPGLNPFELDVRIFNKPLSISNIKNLRQTIDMSRGRHSTSFATADGAVEITYTVMALRQMPNCGMVLVEIRALRSTTVSVQAQIGVPQEYTDLVSRMSGVTIDGRWTRIMRTSARSRHLRRLVAASSAFILPPDSPFKESVVDDKANLLTANLKGGDVATFALVGSICTERDYLDPESESDREVIYAVKEGSDRLLNRHDALWRDLWQGDIIIEGDDEVQQLARFSLYNLYSSARAGSRLSIAPFGLTSAGYNGHVFWDTETWMYPPMLMLNLPIARSMMDYRFDRLNGARRRAYTYGYEGAMFPWESDEFGEESCPNFALTGPFEHHITADVALAAWNYFRATADTVWLAERGYPILEGAADFWVSRCEPNADGTYSIRNVVCADEFAEGVDDNGFTNASARLALQAATCSAEILGRNPSPKWAEVADRIRIPMGAPGEPTPEYDGYDGRTIKQADANLLAYPLGVITDPEQIRRDLAYYEPRMAADGPAMSLSILALQYARLGDADKAYNLFRRSYQPNMRPPFGVISESATSDATAFLTGSGGFLQTIINGFGGLELTDEGVVQLPSAIPSHWRRLEIRGVGPDRRTFVRTHN